MLTLLSCKQWMISAALLISIHLSSVPASYALVLHFLLKLTLQSYETSVNPLLQPLALLTVQIKSKCSALRLFFHTRNTDNHKTWSTIVPCPQKLYDVIQTFTEKLDTRLESVTWPATRHDKYEILPSKVKFSNSHLIHTIMTFLSKLCSPTGRNFLSEEPRRNKRIFSHSQCDLEKLKINLLRIRSRIAYCMVWWKCRK